MSLLLTEEPEKTFDPCPFCGDQNITVGYDGQPALDVYCICLRCGARGPNFMFQPGMEFDLNRAWNNRYTERRDDRPDK